MDVAGNAGGAVAEVTYLCGACGQPNGSSIRTLLFSHLSRFPILTLYPFPH